jgi:hypothetical protein
VAGAREEARASDGHKDYSATPVWKKLGVRKGARLLLVGAPAGFRHELEALAPLPSGVEIRTRAAKGLDVVVLFATRRADVERRFAGLATRLDPAGRLWVAWPKKAAKVETDLAFESVQRIGLNAGLVDNKSATVDGTFQGLQFVYRVKDRPGR